MKLHGRKFKENRAIKVLWCIFLLFIVLKFQYEIRAYTKMFKTVILKRRNKKILSLEKSKIIISFGENIRKGGRPESIKSVSLFILFVIFHGEFLVIFKSAQVAIE